MTARSIFLTAALLLGLALTESTTRAEPPSGSITNEITGATNSIWDVRLLFPQLSGDTWAGDLSATAIRATNDAVQASLSVPHTLNGRGRLLGSGTNDFSLARLTMVQTFYTNDIVTYATNDDQTITTNHTPVVVSNWSWMELTNYGSFPGTYTVRGSVTGVKGVAIVHFMGRELGQAPLDGVLRRASITKAFDVLVGRPYSSISIFESSLLNFAGKPRYLTSDHFLDFNPFVSDLGGGGWTLVLNFDAPAGPNTNRLSGDASVTLSSGNVYPFHFTGRYSPKTHLSTLSLKGVQGTEDTQDGRGAHLSVTLTNSELLRLFGRVAGQAVKLK